MGERMQLSGMLTNARGQFGREFVDLYYTPWMAGGGLTATTVEHAVFVVWVSVFTLVCTSIITVAVCQLRVDRLYGRFSVKCIL